MEWHDDLSVVAPHQWAELIVEYRAFCKRNLPNDCRQLLRMISEAEQVGWAGYTDRETYLRDGLDVDPQAVEWALRGLGLVGVEAPVPFQEAQQLGKHGRPTKAEAEKGYNVTFSTRGNSATYREAKSRRDGKPAAYYREKPLTTLRRTWNRASAEDRAQFLREIAS